MSLLDSHLEQIMLSSGAIAELPLVSLCLSDGSKVIAN
jgi:hypothetical protein